MDEQDHGSFKGETEFESKTSESLGHDIIQEKSGDEPTRIVPGSKEDPYRSYRFLKQSCIIATWISIGLYAGVIGPTLPDLRDSIGVDMGQISATLIFKTIGFLTGAVIGGFLFNIFYKKSELIMFVGIAGMATIMFAPWGESLGIMCFFFWTAGTAEGVVNVGGNPMVMHIWEEKAPTPLLLTHFGFGVGSVIAPLVANPFIAIRSDDVGNSTTASTLMALNKDTGLVRNTYSMLRWEFDAMQNSEPHSEASGFETNIKSCYAICGVLIICISLYQLYFVIKGPPKGYTIWSPNAPLRQMLDPVSCSHGDRYLGIQLLICLFLYYGLIKGSQSAFADFLYSFATESDLQMQESEAAALNSSFYLCYTLGRLFGGAMAHYISVSILIASSLVASVGIMTVLVLFGEADPTVFWIFTCLLGFVITILFPAGMAWSNIYLHMNSMSTMVLLIGSSCGSVPFQYLAGYVYEEFSPSAIMYVSLTGYVCCLMMFIVMQIIGSCHGTKAQRDDKGNGQEGDKHDADILIAVGVDRPTPEKQVGVVGFSSSKGEKVTQVEEMGRVNPCVSDMLSEEDKITRF